MGWKSCCPTATSYYLMSTRNTQPCQCRKVPPVKLVLGRYLSTLNSQNGLYNCNFPEVKGLGMTYLCICPSFGVRFSLADRWSGGSGGRGPGVRGPGGLPLHRAPPETHSTITCNPHIWCFEACFHTAMVKLDWEATWSE